jgi:ornithine cyclodeaminase
MAAPSVFRESERSADHVAGFRPLLAGDRGRRDEELEAYRRDMEPEGFALTLTRDMNDLTQACNLIVTATRAVEPVIEGGVRRGTHITAVGADAPGKQELATQIVAEADRVVADSKEQCVAQGEIQKAVKEGLLDPDSVVELGTVIADRSKGRESDDQITVADLTGVAVQDVGPRG